MNTKEIIKALELLEKEKGLSKESIIEALEQAISNAFQKEQRNINRDAVIKTKIDLETGEIKLWTNKTIVEEVEDNSETFEISLKDAKEINAEAELGDEIEVPFDTNIDDLSRMAAIHAKQILKQKIREAEKKNIQELYADKVGEIITGIIDRVEPRFVTIDLGKTFAYLNYKSMIPGEVYKAGQVIKVYIANVNSTNPQSKETSQIEISRTEPGFIRRLMEQEIHEIYDGSIEIKAIVREPGQRAKVAVSTKLPNVEPTGACIGPKGSRIINISNQLNGEKIDVINYYDDAAMFIIESMKPAQLLGIILNQDGKAATVIVRDEDLSQAIGKSGQNVRLASRITGWNIDIKKESIVVEEKLEYTPISEIKLMYEAKRVAMAREVVRNSILQREKQQEQKENVEVVEYINESSDAVAKEPVVEVVSEKVQEAPVAEVKKVKIKDVAPAISLSELEKELERERTQSKTVAPTYKKKYKFEEKEEKIDKKALEAQRAKEEEIARNYMPVYTEEELKELEAEEENQSSDIDFDIEDYDTYYEED